jgi:Fic family protein
MQQSTSVSVYDQPHQFEPLLPQKNLEELVCKTRSVIEKSFELQGMAHPATRHHVRELVRSMNSYYSNLIEGQNTHPLNIDRALKQDFSIQPDVAQRQRIALAHIEAEKELEQELAAAQQPSAELNSISANPALTSAFLLRAHASLYRRLPPEDRHLPDPHKPLALEPGVLRREDVLVGQHQPPTWSSVGAFLHRADEVYGKAIGLDASLYTIAAAHQRMAWVHPFLDGNGRACRLQTHSALLSLSGGLWSVNRGLARQRNRYYELLSNADMPRHGDLDGRGNLSEKMLRDWCLFFIDLCEDQVTFMTRMLDLSALKQRIAGLILVRSQSGNAPQEYRQEAILPLHHICAAGPVSRSEFIQMTGLGERTARKLLAQLLKDQLLVSKGPKSDVEIGFPLDALNLLFPNLYPEAATQVTEE